MKLIFLDIDGVLNGHEYCSKSRSSTIQRDKMMLLNDIIENTGAQVVISSAWRYMIHGGAMTLQGFQYLFQTYGAYFTLAGYTQKDEYCGNCHFMNDSGIFVCAKCNDELNRGKLISIWLKENNHTDKYVVIDDLDLGISDAGHPFIQTSGKVGLQHINVQKTLEILK